MKNTILTLSDLKRLGKQKEVTALLETGEEIRFTPYYALIKKRAIIFGKEEVVEVIVRFVDIYKKIRTIKNKNRLIARRKRIEGKHVLVFIV